MITAEAPFDSTDIARRYSLGKHALELAKEIRGEQDAESLRQALDAGDMSMFSNEGGAQNQASG